MTPSGRVIRGLNRSRAPQKLRIAQIDGPPFSAHLLPCGSQGCQTPFPLDSSTAYALGPDAAAPAERLHRRGDRRRGAAAAARARVAARRHPLLADQRRHGARGAGDRARVARRQGARAARPRAQGRGVRAQRGHRADRAKVAAGSASRTRSATASSGVVLEACDGRARRARRARRLRRGRARVPRRGRERPAQPLRARAGGRVRRRTPPTRRSPRSRCTACA